MFDVFKKSKDKLASVTDELIIDIYANSEADGLIILIDRPFRKKLLSLELNLKTNSLIFQFDGEKKDLGSPLKNELIPFFTSRQEVHIFHMDIETKQPLEGWTVPLYIIEK